MATVKVKSSITPSSVPSGLTRGEIAVNIPDRRVFIGSGTETVDITGVRTVNGLTGALTVSGGTGMSVLSGGSGITLVNTGVLSVNGSTGAVANVARTNVNNNFSATQTIGATGIILTLIDNDLLNQIYFNPTITNIVSYADLTNTSQTLQFDNSSGDTTTATLPAFNTVLAGLSGTQTFGGTKTFNALTNFNGGISAAGGITFNSDVSVNSANTLNVSTIRTISGKAQLDIENRANARVAIGDYGDLDAGGNGTNIFLRDDTSVLEIANPVGVIEIGDPQGIDSGATIQISPAAEEVDFGNFFVTGIDTLTTNGLITTNGGISASNATFSGLVSFIAGLSGNGITLSGNLSANGISASGATLGLVFADSVYSSTTNLALFDMGII